MKENITLPTNPPETKSMFPSKKTMACLRMLLVLIALVHAAEAMAVKDKPVTTPFINGVVVAVYDGDTIGVNTGRKTILIRFYGVDCPETKKTDAWKAQPYSREAKEFVRAMILNKPVSVRLKNDISYNRQVGEVFYDGLSLSRELVRRGLAWWNKKFEPNDADLKRLQRQARQEHLGLWHDAHPVPPWAHRHRRRQ